MAGELAHMPTDRDESGVVSPTLDLQARTDVRFERHGARRRLDLESSRYRRMTDNPKFVPRSVFGRAARVPRVRRSSENNRVDSAE